MQRPVCTTDFQLEYRISPSLSLPLSLSGKRKRERERGPNGDRRRLDEKVGEEAERKGGGGLYRFRGLRRPR